MILGANSTSDPMRDAMNRNLNQQQTLQSFSSNAEKHTQNFIVQL